ncbi:MAG: hypothetical protein K6T54_11140 [Ignavibacterium sp.]|nr:hypothetical protein [Ignavibacterium sp.]
MNNTALVVNCNDIMALPVIRLLGQNNINVDAIFGNRKTKANYQILIKKSKYIKNALFFDENEYEENLINLLIEYGQKCKLKPVLFLASDTVLNYVSANRDKLKEFYHLTLPPHSVINQILCKEKFIELATKLDLPIPKSFKTTEIKSIYDMLHKIPYPFIIKPSWRTNSWLEKFKELKVFKINNSKELDLVIKQLEEFETYYLVQEIISGNDDQIYCSFAILNHYSEPIEIGFCRKVTQFPTHFGNTSIATPFYDEHLKQLSEVIYKKLNLVGYASIEFKLDPSDNEYKIIEITPNRFNRQFAVTTLNGLNLSFQLYRFELNLPPVKTNFKKSKNFWMSETNEIRRIKGLKQKKLKEIFLLVRRIIKTRIFEIFDLRDIKPFTVLIKNQFKSYFAK